MLEHRLTVIKYNDTYTFLPIKKGLKPYGFTFFLFMRGGEVGIVQKIVYQQAWASIAYIKAILTIEWIDVFYFFTEKIKIIIKSHKDLFNVVVFSV